MGELDTHNPTPSLLWVLKKQKRPEAQCLQAQVVFHIIHVI